MLLRVYSIYPKQHLIKLCSKLSKDENVDELVQRVVSNIAKKDVSPVEENVFGDYISSFPLIPSRDAQKFQENVNKKKFDAFVETYDKLKSVKTILTETAPIESQVILANWRKSKIKEMGVESFMKEVSKGINNGTRIHYMIHQKVSGKVLHDYEIPESVKGYWESLKEVWKSVGSLHLSEHRLNHSFLAYRGTVDSVFEYKDNICAVEWKASKKVKATVRETHDTPIQIAAYIGCINSNPNFNKNLIIERGLIVVCYENGDPADIFILSPEKILEYWQKWIGRLSLFWNTQYNLNKSPASQEE